MRQGLHHGKAAISHRHKARFRVRRVGMVFTIFPQIPLKLRAGSLCKASLAGLARLSR